MFLNFSLPIAVLNESCYKIKVNKNKSLLIFSLTSDATQTYDVTLFLLNSKVYRVTPHWVAPLTANSLFFDFFQYLLWVFWSTSHKPFEIPKKSKHTEFLCKRAIQRLDTPWYLKKYTIFTKKKFHKHLNFFLIITNSEVTKRMGIAISLANLIITLISMIFTKKIVLQLTKIEENKLSKKNYQQSLNISR